MPKRTFWLVTGAAVGAGSSLWAERKVRRTVQQAAAKLQPDALVVEVGKSARQVAGSAADRVRDAVSTGRDEMQRREEELWAELAAQGVETMPPMAESAVAPERRAGSRGSRSAGRRRRPLSRSTPRLDN
jgi:succinyl-CoA synthetase alpha subunit